MGRFVSTAGIVTSLAAEMIEGFDVLSSMTSVIGWGMSSVAVMDVMV